MHESDMYSDSVELVVKIYFCLDDHATRFPFTYIRYPEMDFLFEVSPEKSESE